MTAPTATRDARAMTEVEAACYFDVMLPLLGLKLEPEYRAGALQYFLLLTRLAAEVDAFGLSRDVPPAPIFQP